jgi:D-glycero-alpha-D-manno-heptose-7-phosphate kinase
MIISRTPYRISFFGGGSDYPNHYLEHGGKVLSTTINKYCFIFVRKLAQFFEHKYRIIYAKTELKNSVDEIENDRVRECLKFLKIKDPLEICYIGELPARSGSGSSSVFTVGLLNALHCYSGKFPSRKQLYEEAIFIEQEILKENVGSQDQVAAAIGGFNYIKFSSSGIIASPVIIKKKRLDKFEKHLLLFFTRITRDSSKTLSSFVSEISSKKFIIRNMVAMVNDGLKILSSNCDIRQFGELLNEAWQYKKQTSPNVSNDYIDSLYNRAIMSGAIGGKITGAGAGGMLLLFCEPKKQKRVISELNELVHVPFKFEYSGSNIIFRE